MLSDEGMFDHVCSTMYKTIDFDGSGSLERIEISKFIRKICEEMGMLNYPDDKTITEMFAECDEDGSNDI